MTILASQAASAQQAPESAPPLVRWWWPNAAVNLEEIDRELQSVSEAGFAGVEVVSLPHKLAIDPTIRGWGTPAWDAAMREVLLQARARGLQVDMTIGPAWPSVIPGLSSDPPEAEKILAQGMVRLTSGDSLTAAPAAEAAPRAGVNVQTLAALVAYPVTGNDNSTPAIDISRGIDLTDRFPAGSFCGP